jgi:hypothetical protein
VDTRFALVVLGALAFASGVAACEKRQENGPRKPTSTCEFVVPDGWVRSPSPMPDHIAELIGEGNPKGTIIIGERPERDPAVAQAAALAYHRGGLLRPQDATEVSDLLLVGARAPGRVLTMRWGAAGAGTLETISLLSFSDTPVIEVIARHEEANAKARDGAAALVRSLRCGKSSK